MSTECTPGKKVERTMHWCREPKMDAWMRTNDSGQLIAAVIDAFEREFGFRLARRQVSYWRAKNGVGRKMGSYKRRNDVPIGAERDSGKGYILVKVAENASVPSSKDNWRMKHHLVWEAAHGEPVPDNYQIMFADRDHSNFDPANLVAVDKRLIGTINRRGLAYWDAKSLEVAIAYAKLISKTYEIETNAPRTCGVCGTTFKPSKRQESIVQTCPKCCAAGKKAHGTPKTIYKRTCAVCGATFDASNKTQRRCPECIARAPKYSVEKQISAEKRVV